MRTRNVCMKLPKSLLSGILAGVGFGITLTIILIYDMWAIDNYKAEIIEVLPCSNFKNCPSKAGLSVNILEDRINNNELTVLGEASNTGTVNWKTFKVKVELFDKNNIFIDECIEYIDQRIYPNDKVNFKISCKRSGKIIIKEHSSLKVFIVDAGTY